MTTGFFARLASVQHEVSIENPRAFLYRCAQNIVADHHRHHRGGGDGAVGRAAGGGDPGQLFEQIAAEATKVGTRFQSLSAADAARIGLHPRLGDMTVGRIVERFLVGHLEEHVEQLRGILATSPTGSPD